MKYKDTVTPKDVAGIVDALTRDFTNKHESTDDVLKKISDLFLHHKYEIHHAKVIL